MRIIAVDDERGALRLLLRAIEKAAPESDISGYEEPRSALEEAKRDIPDVAFLDINIAEISGLDLADKLRKINPNINIVYVTGYSEYATKAFRQRASGYIMKPVSQEEVKRELDNLRNPVCKKNGCVRFVTFGGFDVYVDNVMLQFKYKKTKELLAFLFDKQGAMSTIKEVEATLWESEGHESYLRRLRLDLLSNMENAGVGDLIICKWGEIGLDISKVKSDYKDYLDNKNDELGSFNNNYLPRYSWAEPRNALLMKKCKLWG